MKSNLTKFTILIRSNFFIILHQNVQLTSLSVQAIGAKKIFSHCFNKLTFRTSFEGNFLCCRQFHLLKSSFNTFFELNIKCVLNSFCYNTDTVLRAHELVIFKMKVISSLRQYLCCEIKVLPQQFQAHFSSNSKECAPPLLGCQLFTASTWELVAEVGQRRLNVTTQHSLHRLSTKL